MMLKISGVSMHSVLEERSLMMMNDDKYLYIFSDMSPFYVGDYGK